MAYRAPPQRPSGPPAALQAWLEDIALGLLVLIEGILAFGLGAVVLKLLHH